MALNDIFRVDYSYNVDTERCHNVFHYQYYQGGDGTFAESIAVLFKTAVHDKIKALQCENVEDYAIDVVRLANPTDYYSTPWAGETGARAIVGQPLPAFIAMSFASNRAQPGTRRGRKRISGFQSTDVAGNYWWATLLSSSLVTDVQTALAASLVTGVWGFRPVVVKHPVILGVNPVLRFLVTSFSVQSKISSQNSRKVGA